MSLTLILVLCIERMSFSHRLKHTQMAVVSKNGTYWEFGSVYFPFAPQRHLHTLF